MTKSITNLLLFFVTAVEYSLMIRIFRVRNIVADSRTRIFRPRVRVELTHVLKIVSGAVGQVSESIRNFSWVKTVG